MPGVERPGRARRSTERPVLLTGGAGFIGTNLAHRLLQQGRSVLILDNLSRPGVARNVEWLVNEYAGRVTLEVGDVRDRFAVWRAVQRADQVFHFAAQVAVTTSLLDPSADFEVNARGTLNVLEAIRTMDEPPPLVFASTNKVYGSLPDVPISRNGDRYAPDELLLQAYGIGEDRPLAFNSPYGCSKGAAEQYVLDYARSFDIPTVVFRMSCIYGPHQHGTEDQGWVAHFLMRAAEGRPITLYGDGRQVRDVLFVEDLVDAFLLAQEHIRTLSGTPFNIGGGPEHTTSLLELIDLIEELHGQRPDVRLAEWRTGDQRYYVSDIRRFQAATGWQPRTSLRKGLERLYDWLLEARGVGPRRLEKVKAAR